MQPPAGAGKVVTVFVPGLAPKLDVLGALIITIPEPPLPALLLFVGTGTLGLLLLPPPPPPPVLAVPESPGVVPFKDPAPPPPAPPKP